MGWPTGFEPATARSTIWGSNRAELWPPPANKLDFRFVRVKFTHQLERDSEWTISAKIFPDFPIITLQIL